MNKESQLTGDIKLRPTRIGFLVKPNDMNAIRKCMRINTCLWGGVYNPIIPVYKVSPKAWAPNQYESTKGYKVAQGYINFFEPDVFVEAEEGLLEKVGLGQYRNNFDSRVSELNNFMSQEYAGIHDPTFGQNIYDILVHKYETERRFQFRDEHPVISTQSNGDAFSDCCIGNYPSLEETQYLERTFTGVFQPQELSSGVELWKKLYLEQALTPLRVTQTYIKSKFSRWGNNELTIYIFNPNSSLDLIDLWNIRLEPAPILPVPINLFDDVLDILKEKIAKNFRPLKNNPSGIMHHTNIEISRSINDERIKDKISTALQDMDRESWRPAGRTPVWKAPFSGKHGPRYERKIIYAEEAQQRMAITEEKLELHSHFSTLSPSFSEDYSGSNFRWANVLLPRRYSTEEIAVTLPYNTFDPSWPRLGMGGEKVNITTEGWVFLQKFKDKEQPVSPIKNTEAFIQWFERQGIQARLSDAGVVAKEVLNHLGGFWGVCFISDPEVLKLLNKMSNRVRKRTEVDEEFEAGTALRKTWKDYIAKRKNSGAIYNLSLSDYTERNILKLGLEVICSHCKEKNWFELCDLNYELQCSRCLKHFPFPQGDVNDELYRWKYRVAGPFSRPDYARGAYSALLTIRALQRLGRGHGESGTFTTAVELKSEQHECEIDFALWYTGQGVFDEAGKPQLVIGEAKSFGQDVIKPKDIEQLKKAVAMLPNSVVVISVLKDQFSQKEKKILTDFVKWTRRTNHYAPKHWVILLTGIELFEDHFIDNKWKNLGNPYNKYTDHWHTDTLENFSNATIAIHLGLDSFYKYDEKRRKSRKRGSNENKR